MSLPPLPLLTGQAPTRTRSVRPLPGFPAWVFLPDSAPETRSLWGVILWWEKRRLLYNRFILIAGALSLLLYLALSSHYSLRILRDYEDIVGSIAEAAILINIAYTLGSAAEIALRYFMRRRDPWDGPWLFKAGVIFSGIIIFALSLPEALYLAIIRGVPHLFMPLTGGGH